MGYMVERPVGRRKVLDSNQHRDARFPLVSGWGLSKTRQDMTLRQSDA